MAEDESPEEPKTSGKGGMMLMLVVPLLAVGAGLALPVVVTQLGSTSSAAAEEAGMAAPDPDEEIDFIPFDKVTVNLDEARFSRFLSLTFSLQVAKSQKSEIEPMIEEKKLIFKNWIQIHLAEKGVEDLKGFGRNQIRRELQDFFNKVLFDDGIERIQNVLFDEFHVQ